MRVHHLKRNPNDTWQSDSLSPQNIFRAGKCKRSGNRQFSDAWTMQNQNANKRTLRSISNDEKERSLTEAGVCFYAERERNGRLAYVCVGESTEEDRSMEEGAREQRGVNEDGEFHDVTCAYINFTS